MLVVAVAAGFIALWTAAIELINVRARAFPRLVASVGCSPLQVVSALEPL